VISDTPGLETAQVPLRLACRAYALLAVAMLVAQASGSGAHAQGRLDARYTASLAGLSLGRGAWVIDIGEDKYLAAASGMTAGLMQLFSSGEGSGAARGSIVKGRFQPTTYSATISSSRRKNEVRIGLNDGIVKDLSVSPPVKPDAERVPLSEAHRRGVIDPMTASLVRATGNGNPLAPGSCPRNVAVFDGRMRYDLHLAYKRMDRVKAQKGYAGPALVCALYFSPIAGHVPDRTAIKYLTELRDMEAWLVPIAGTSVLVPFRVTVPTPLGLGVVQATQFVTAAHKPRAAVSAATK
jgi:hypothetical protein